MCQTTTTGRSFISSPFEALESRQLFAAGFLTAADPYLVPSAPGVEIKPLLTVGESVPETGNPGGAYQMVGIPDGLGAYDNGDGTFTVLMNHELRPDRGAVRDHGSKGAFVSKWVLDKATGAIISGDDLIKQVRLWNSATNSFDTGTTAIVRLCSADLPDATAFYDPATGLGTTARIFMSGEESSNGRAFASVVTGSEAGTSWELPWAGKYAWENNLTSPFSQPKTIVVGMDDSRREFSSEGAAQPSEVYVWVGNKQATGTEIEKAGLGRNGVLHGVRVGMPGAYDANESTVTSGERFELVGLSDQTNNATFAPLQTESIAKTVTQFRRVEDGHWDATNPNVFYYITTDRFGGQTRAWKLTFDDIRNPEAGGKIEIAVDSPAAVPGEMFDNMTVNRNGDLLLQEDPGNQAYLAKIWQFDTSAKDLIQIAEHNPDYFSGPLVAPSTSVVASRKDLDPNTPGMQGTQNEESSGIIDVSEILGPGRYLAVVQAHYALPDPLVEAGQFLLINTNAARATLDRGVLTVTGTVDDDRLSVSRKGSSLTVSFAGRTLGTFARKSVSSVRVSGINGDDVLWINENVQVPALLLGGNANDVLVAGGGRSILVGGLGTDILLGGEEEDVLLGEALSLDDAALASALNTWAGDGGFSSRAKKLETAFAGRIIDDGAPDLLVGGGSNDYFPAGGGIEGGLGKHNDDDDEGNHEGSDD